MRLLFAAGMVFAAAVAASPIQEPAPNAGSTAMPTRSSASDLDKMQVLLEQMQRNVAFVSPGQTPLKHQMELEISMWEQLLKHMRAQEGLPAAQ